MINVSHVKVTQSELVKLLCCQVLNVPYQSLYGNSEFYQGKPVRALTGNEELNVEDINRDVLSRLRMQDQTLDLKDCF